MDRTEARQLLTVELDRLTRSRATLAEQVELARVAQQGAPQDSTELSEGIGDRMDVVAELAAVDAEIADVCDALKRIEAGTYGRCADCGEAIGDERLRAMPDATRCVRHQTTRDAGGRRLSAR